MPSREILYGIGCSCPDRRTSLKRAGRVGRATVAWGSGLVNEPFGEEIAVPRPMERRRGRGRQARAGSHRSRRESARRLPRDGSETSRIGRAPERTEAIGLVSRRTPFLLFERFERASDILDLRHGLELLRERDRLSNSCSTPRLTGRLTTLMPMSMGLQS